MPWVSRCDFLTVLPFMMAVTVLEKFLHEKVAEIGEVLRPDAGVAEKCLWDNA